MSLQRSRWLGLRIAAMLAAGGGGTVWLETDALNAQEVQVQIVGGANVQIGFAMVAPAAGVEARAETAQRWIRGFIQNELNNVELICKPSKDDAQALVNVAEQEWKTRLSSTIRAYSESQNQRIPADFESRVERLVQIWLRETLNDEQNERWQGEIDARAAYRKRIVIGRMVADCERKFGLTHAQMMEMEQVLLDRWKDSWWAMYRTGTLPETKFSWIMKILSESQRTAGFDRVSQVTEHFMGGGFVDMPTLKLDERFKIGDVTSAGEIPLAHVDSAESVEIKNGPLIDGPGLKDIWR